MIQILKVSDQWVISMTSEGEIKLKDHEGKRLWPYDDATGERLIPGSMLKGNITIGWGTNLSAGISHEVAIILFNMRYDRAVAECRSAFPWFDTLDDVRQDVIVNLAYNMGVSSLLNFHKMLASIARQDWDEAAYELLNSKWATDVQKARRDDLSKALETGQWI